MSEYWKSTPSYWCKFCSQYVKDTGIERKNHEASVRHQNNIQRSIRELSKTKEREEREQQRAKSEVARLNGLVGGEAKGGKTASASGPKILGVQDLGANKGAATSNVSTAQQRKAHAEQLLALGVELPEALKREITGVGGWETVSQRVVEDDATAERSLADIVKEEHDSKEDVKFARPLNKGVHKRKADEEEDAEQSARRKAWGSRLKTYPGKEEGGDGEDLDALLSGVVGRKKLEEDAVKKEEEREEVKEEADGEEKPLSAIPDIDAPAAVVKQEAQAGEAPVVFKKRKIKR